MVLVRSSKEPEKPEAEGAGQAGKNGSGPPRRLALVPKGSPDQAPEGGSGEWLQQYAWALEDNNLEQAAWLLKWILAKGEAWAVAQAADLAIDRLAQVPEGKGAAAALVRLYHALGPLFPESHAFHGAFLSRLEAQVRALVAGPQAMTAASAIERALELFKSHLTHHESYGSLREALTDVQQRSRVVVQHEKERELEELLATGDTFRAIELCRELIEAFQSPLASGLMPTLLVQAGTLQREASVLAGRRAKEWDWPEPAPPETQDGVRFNPRTGRPYATDVRHEVEPPRTAWSRAFDAPLLGRQPSGAEDEVGSEAREAAARSHFSTFLYPPSAQGETPAVPMVPPHGQAPRGPAHGLHIDPELTTLPVVPEHEPVVPVGYQAPAIDPAMSQPVLPARIEPAARPEGSRVGRWVAMLVVALLAALIGWGIAQRSRPAVSPEKPAPAQPVGQAAPPAAKPDASANPASETTALVIPDPGAVEATGRLTLEITPNDKLELYVDGVLRPDGRVESLALVPGLHTIEVFREEHERFVQQVYVSSSGETRFQVTLAQSPKLNVSIEPPDGLEIKLDERKLNVAPPLIGYVISPGKHRLEVNRSGYQTHVEEFTAVTGSNLMFQIALKTRTP